MCECATLLQYGIENKTNDIDNLYIRSYTNATPYNKAFKQTNFVRNRGFVEFMLQGFIMGNNVNIDYSDDFGLKKSESQDDDKFTVDSNGNIVYLESDDDEEEKFSGAIVADSRLNSFNGLKVLGYNSNTIFNRVGDMDFSAMYPHIIIVFNISPATMVGKLLLSYVPPMYRDADRYDSGQDLVDNYLCGNMIGFGKKWLHTDDHETLDSKIRNKFIV